MRVLVTGAAGFLGREVVASLLRRGHAVTAVVRPSTDVSALPWIARVRLLRADLRRHSDLASELKDVDAVVHLAIRHEGADEEVFAAGVVGTERLLAAMGEAEVRRLVHASSFSVYDWSRVHGRLDEDSPVDDPYRRRDAYATAKIWQERIVRRRSAAGMIDPTFLRPGFIWGPGQPWPLVVGERLGALTIVVAPTARPALSYVENCADCFAAAVESDAAIGQTFNVVDEDGPTSWQFAARYLERSGGGGIRVPLPYSLGWMLVRLIGWTSRLLFGERGRLPSLATPEQFESRFKTVECSAAPLRRILSWNPRRDFEAAMGRALPRHDELG